MDGLAATLAYLSELSTDERALAIDAVIRVRARHRRKHGNPSLNTKTASSETMTLADRQKSLEHSTEIQRVMNSIAQTLFEVPAISWAPSGSSDPHLLAAQRYHRLWATHLAIRHGAEIHRLLGPYVDATMTASECLAGLRCIDLHLKGLSAGDLAKAAAAIAHAYPEKPAHL